MPAGRARQIRPKSALLDPLARPTLRRLDFSVKIVDSGWVFDYS